MFAKCHVRTTTTTTTTTIPRLHSRTGRSLTSTCSGPRGRGRGGRGGRLGPPLALFVAALDVDPGSGMFFSGFGGDVPFRAVFPSVVRYGPEGQSASLVRSSSTLAVACAVLVFLPRAVFPLVADRPRWPSWTRRIRTQLVGFSLRSLVSGSLLFYFGSCVSSTVRVYSSRRLPELPYSALLGWTVDTYLCQSMGFWEYYLRIQRNARSSVVHAMRWLRSSTRRIPCRGAEAWSCCSADHSNSPVAALG